MGTKSMDTNFTDDELNMFVDDQMADQEAQQIHAAMLSDPVLRERICQVRAVRELVGYAYAHPPRSCFERRKKCYQSGFMRSIAASFILMLGGLVGWYGHDFTAQHSTIANSAAIFQYLANNVPASHNTRKIVIHVDTGNVLALKKAMDETEQLVKSYRVAGTPLNIDVVTNKGGINLLRVGVSPYSSRIEAMIKANKNIHFYACARSIAKAEKKEGRDIVMLPGANVAKTAREIIPDLIDKGWVYIKV